MTRLFLLLALLVAWLVAPSEARADPVASSSWDSDEGMGITRSLYASNRVCTPGSQVTCSCPGGGRSTQTCDPTGIRFSVCACASVTVVVPDVRVPQVIVQQPDFRRKRRKPSKPYSGLGMLIAGSVVITVGVPNLIWGIDRVRDHGGDPEGILSIVHGGVCLATGLPLLIVGSVLLGIRGLNPEAEPQPQQSKSAPIFTLTPTGFAAQF